MAKKTENISDVRNAVQAIGDSLTKTFEETKDLKAGQGAVQAYSVAIKAAQAQLIYKKLTGGPDKIKFFETTK